MFPSGETGPLYRAESFDLIEISRSFYRHVKCLFASKQLDQFTDRKFLTTEFGENRLSESGNVFGTSKFLHAEFTRVFVFLGANDLSQRTSSSLIGE